MSRSGFCCKYCQATRAPPAGFLATSPKTVLNCAEHMCSTLPAVCDTAHAGGSAERANSSDARRSSSVPAAANEWRMLTRVDTSSFST